MNATAEQRVVLCLSGGMDSTSLLLRYLARGYRVFGVSFDYGQRHIVELDRLRDNLKYFRDRGAGTIEWHRVDLRTAKQLLASALTRTEQEMPIGHYEQESMKATFVPNRNAIFSSLAFGYALSIATRDQSPIALSLAVHSGDHAIYPDCRPGFYQALFHAFRIGNWNSELVQLELPYIQCDKSQILVDARRSVEALGLDFDTVFRNTCTSYLPDDNGRSHGLTGSDVERILAFYRCGWADPVEYQATWPEVVEQALAFERQYTKK